MNFENAYRNSIRQARFDAKILRMSTRGLFLRETNQIESLAEKGERV
jgi:hypothetical protein